MRSVSQEGAGGIDVSMAQRNMSYTNLAEMASAFETHQLMVPAASSRKRPAAAVDAETAYAAAMESVNAGLQLDASDSLAEALAMYQKGACLLYTSPSPRDS